MPVGVLLWACVLACCGLWASPLCAQRIVHSPDSAARPAPATTAPDSAAQHLAAAALPDHSQRIAVAPLRINSAHHEFLPAFYDKGFYYMYARKQRKNVAPPLGRLQWPASLPMYGYLLPHPDSASGAKRVWTSSRNGRHLNFGTPSQHSNGDYLHFTRSAPAAKRGGQAPLKVYQARTGGNVWYSLQAFRHNSDSFSVAHPSLSPDGKTMFFVSDMPGGMGGSDLYLCQRDSAGQWGQPQNLGPTVNSTANELYPFFHAEGNLYFSSDRPGGFGGLDMYEAVRGLQGFSRVVNLGAPLNSLADDLGLIINSPKRKGYFSSNRSGGKGGFDLYALDVKALHISRNLTDTGDNVFGIAPMQVTGMLIDSLTLLPIKRALVKIRDFNEDDIKVTFSDNQGRYSFYISNDNQFQVAASKIGYHSTPDLVFSTYGLPPNEPLNIDIRMNPLNFKLELKVLVREAQAAPDAEALPVRAATLTMQDLTAGTTAVKQANNDGQVVFYLDQGRAYKLQADAEGYQASLPYRITTNELANARSLEFNVPLTKKEQPHKALFFIRAKAHRADTLLPVPFASVVLHRASTALRRQTYANEQGVAVFAVDTLDAFKFEAVKEGFQMDNFAPLTLGEVRKGDTLDIALPMHPADHKPVPLDLQIDPIRYEEARDVFNDDIRRHCESVLDILNEYRSLKISIESHAQATESVRDDYELSRRRANAILAYLVRQGLQRERIISVNALGSTQPKAPCVLGECTEGHHSVNRRTEFVIVER